MTRSDGDAAAAPRQVPAVTVVIPAYRAERTIRRTLDSLLAQQGVALDIIVVIDGLLDGTLEEIRRLQDPRIRVLVHETNQGASRARNAGLAETRDDLVMFVDADDFVEGPLIAALAERMGQADADLGFGPMQILFEGEGRRLPRFVPPWQDGAETFRAWHADERYVNPTSVMWRTAFLRRIEGWDPQLTRNDDGELVNRALLLGARIITSAEGQGVYVLHSADTLNHRADNMDSMLQANRKLLALPTETVPEPERRRICGEHALNIASHAYLAGRDDLGRRAYADAMALGVRARGALPYRVGFRLLGPKRLVRVVRTLKRILGR